MANLIGQVLGQYKITALVGEGGMATVYQARQESIKRSVAIKVIESKLARNPDFVRRFEREAQTVASLSHSHILKVFDYGQHDDLLYLVMELLTGGSLADLLSRGPLPPNVASQMLDQIASALDYAHRRGIIHRDLKPQNVLLDDNSDAHLTDFGIAKILSETTALTLSGVAMGTPAYMAPEQWSGDALDARADIYSLGVMLFEMMTGKVPFQANTPASMMHAHIYEAPPPVRTFRSDLPPGVDAVIQKALAKDRDQRYGSAGEMASAFKLALAGQMPVAATPPSKAGPATMIEAPMPRQTPVMLTAPLRLPTSKRRNTPILVLVGIVIAVLLIGGAFFLLSRNTPPSTTPTIPAVALQPTATTLAIGEPQTSEVTSTPNLEQRAAGTITARAANAINATQMFTPTLTETADEQETLNAMVTATLSLVAPVSTTSSTPSPIPPSPTSTETASSTFTDTASPEPPTVTFTVTNTSIPATHVSTLSLQFQATPTFEPTYPPQTIARPSTEKPQLPEGLTGSTNGLLSLRTEPDDYAHMAGTILPNSTFALLGRTADGSWLYANYNGITGWVVATSVTLTNGSQNYSQLPVNTATPTPLPAQSLSGSTNGLLSLRTEPDDYAHMAGTILPNSTFVLLGRTADGLWLYVNYNGITGWVVATGITLTNGSQNYSQLPVNTTTPTPLPAQSLSGSTNGLLSLRTEPDDYAHMAGTILPNSTFVLLGRTADGLWLYVNYNGITGWVVATGVTPSNGSQNYSQLPVISTSQ